MASIYIHIPFCKQACHYCDFHFSTSMGNKEGMIQAIQSELVLRKMEFALETVDCIYFGGGTPSVLDSEEIEQILTTVFDHYKISATPEITLEANPDDLTIEKVRQLAASPVNRLSIGVQSFFREDLRLMNRVHNEQDAIACIRLTQQYFENISIDLIYGIPGMTLERWKRNLDIALDFNIPHISAYALTVEPKTALAHFIEKEIIAPVDDAVAQEHHQLLTETMKVAGYDNYEFSNFGKPGFYSQNNTAYWQGQSYIGIGPGAHSYDGQRRAWNISNNPKYIKAIVEKQLPQEVEVLSLTDRYNEYVMTRLRTQDGISLTEVVSIFGERFKIYVLAQAHDFITEGLMRLEGDQLRIAQKEKFLSDGIAADLFMVNLKND